MKKIPPSVKIRKRLEEIRQKLKRGLVEMEEGQELIGELFREGIKLIIQEMLEGEVKEFLGREYYERSDECRGYRNGYESLRVKTPLGKIAVETPQVRDTEERFSSKVKEFFKRNPDVLKKLVAEMYARGLSTRDIEDALEEATGERVLSKSTISEITEVLWEEYEAFEKQELSSLKVVYLLVDAIYESLRKEFGIKEAVLVAWGILEDGRKVLLGISLGNKESYRDWLEFLRSLCERGLNVPLSVTSDGAPGLKKAIEDVFPQSLRLRCWRHKMENLSHKVPKEIWQEIAEEIRLIRDSLSYEEGKRRLNDFVERYKNEYPSLVKCLLDDWEASLNILKLPLRHRKSVRTTNLVERSFVEERRRSKVIGGFFTEKAGLKIVFSVLMRASRRWRRIPMGEKELAQIRVLKNKLGIEDEEMREVLNAS
jgi:transposase-like protein